MIKEFRTLVNTVLTASTTVTADAASAAIILTSAVKNGATALDNTSKMLVNWSKDQLDEQSANADLAADERSLDRLQRMIAIADAYDKASQGRDLEQVRATCKKVADFKAIR